MVITVNSVLGGATVAVVVSLAADAPLIAVVGAGLAAGFVLLIVGTGYERTRVSPLVSGRGAVIPSR